MLGSHKMVLVDAFRPRSLAAGRALAFDALTVLTGSAFIALLAQVRVPLPFTPVPITGQTLAVLLVGAALGSRRGMLAVLAYLLPGAAGLPVFTGFGFGLAVLLGPTGGYLLGFLPAAWLVGFLAERGWDRDWRTNYLAMFAGSLVIYAFGVAWLSKFVGWGRVLPLGVLPFVGGDLVKVVLATALLPSAWRLKPPSR